MSLSRLAIPSIGYRPTTSTLIRERQRGLVHATIQRLDARSSSIAPSPWDDAAPPHRSVVTDSDRAIQRWVANTQLNLWVVQQLGGTWPSRDTSLEIGQTPTTQGPAPAAAAEKEWDFNASTVPPAARMGPMDTEGEGWGSLETPERSRSVQDVTDDADSWTEEGFLCPLAQEGLVDDTSDVFSEILRAGEGYWFYDPASEGDWHGHGDEPVEDMVAPMSTDEATMESGAAAIRQPHNVVELAPPWPPVIPAPTREVAVGATHTMSLGHFHFRRERRPMQRRVSPGPCKYGAIGEGRPSSAKDPVLALSIQGRTVCPYGPVGQGRPSRSQIPSFPGENEDRQRGAENEAVARTRTDENLDSSK
ncbi:hypothetical protein B0H12DRAFT_1109748 [Mycena haematopus]|nr:hypothetical protein B0H12DRAFT_1109748 [Mycena haematopus]